MKGLSWQMGVTWKEDTLFVSETILAHTPKTKEGEKKPALKSGVYAFTLAELQRCLIKLSPYSENSEMHLQKRLMIIISFLKDGMSTGFYSIFIKHSSSWAWRNYRVFLVTM